MIHKKVLASGLLLSFLLGIGLITNGLASLPQAYERPETTIIGKGKFDQPQEVDENTIKTKIIKFDKNKLYIVKSGDTFSKILENLDIDVVEASTITDEINRVYKVNRIRPGMEIHIEREKKGDLATLKSLMFKPSIVETLEVKAAEGGKFEAKLTEIPLEKVIIRATGEIEGSLYQSAKRAGVTESILAQTIKALSYSVDFQRDIKAGDKFKIVYEAYTDQAGEFIKSSKPLYINLKLKNKEHEIFIVERANGSFGYYDKNGVSARRALLRTPVDGARITSGFGMRRHPILGYSKLHKGVDFGAPTGTRVFAAGDGVIERLGYFGAYGNYIRIKHTQNYSTAYAHLSRYQKGMRAGTRVKQGDLIAYVGTTGRSTGPHLHFEVLKNNSQINPISANITVEDKLTGKEMANFQAQKKLIASTLESGPTKADLGKKPAEAAKVTAPTN